MLQQFLEIGKIVSVHGLDGTVKVQPWCDSAAFLCSFETLYCGKEHRAVRVLHARVQKEMAFLQLEGVETPEQAEQLRNTVLYMNRADVELEDGTYFIQDLLGLSVQDADSGICYGQIADVLQTGANDVYVLRDAAGVERLVPVIPDVVLETNLAEGVVRIRPLKGLFDDAD